MCSKQKNHSNLTNSYYDVCDRFVHMTGGQGGPGNMGASSGMTAAGGPTQQQQLPPGYNTPNLSRQAGGPQQQLQGPNVNASYMHQQQQQQRQRQAQQAALIAQQQQQQQQQQQHMAAVQGHGGGAVQQQPNSAGLISLQRQMSGQQQPGNQYNPYQYN